MRVLPKNEEILRVAQEGCVFYPRMNKQGCVFYLPNEQARLLILREEEQARLLRPGGTRQKRNGVRSVSRKGHPPVAYESGLGGALFLLI
ncbi:MAG: hypothetical protein ACPGWR_26900 [Ardenticatenaceae bacterium]